MRNLVSLTLMAFASTALAQQGALPGAGMAPSGWRATPASHLDSVVKHSGRYSARLSAEQPMTVSLRQAFDPEQLRGKRVRYTAWIKSDLTNGDVGLWMRVDSAPMQSIAFDNMSGRRVEGRTEWTEHSIVLDIPQAAGAITFGILMQAAGNAWMDDVKLEVVDKSVPSTDINAEIQAQMAQMGVSSTLSDSARRVMLQARVGAPKWPRNLGFEDR